MADQPMLDLATTAIAPPIDSPAPAAERTHCECGAPFRFDPTIEGETCGGLYRVGWLVCTAPGCARTSVSKRGHGGGSWKIAASGRSIDAGDIRLRAEGGKKGDAIDPTGVMQRIARLPDLEAALRKIARGDGDAAAIARAALEVGP